MPKCKQCPNEAVPGIQLCQRCRELQAARSASWNERHGPELRARQTQRRREFRIEVINRLGGECVCCGETEPNFLTVDHPNDDGGNHRRELRLSGGRIFYERIMRDWDRLRYDLRVLCWNCHMSRSFWKVCPHQAV